eukprot:GEMP01000557.1.p1 GENE.GEMP01000557.1~~GEMP01000557.1.p1  ORF type:complete len:2126 (+),score=548.47 GEMP01000557.1:25-6402(+)
MGDAVVESPARSSTNASVTYSNCYLRAWLERGDGDVDELRALIANDNVRSRFQERDLHKHTPTPSAPSTEKVDRMPDKVKTFCDEVAGLLNIDAAATRQLLEVHVGSGPFTDFSVAHHRGGRYDYLELEGGAESPLLVELHALLHAERVNLIYCIGCIARFALDSEHPFSPMCRRMATTWCQEDMLGRLCDAFEDLDRDVFVGSFAYGRVQERLELQISLLEVMLILGSDEEVRGPLDCEQLTKMLEIFHAQKFLGSLCRFNTEVNYFLSRERSATFLWHLGQRVGDLCVALLLQYILVADKFDKHPLVNSEYHCSNVHSRFVEWTVAINRRTMLAYTVEQEVANLIEDHSRRQMTLVVICWLSLLSSSRDACRTLKINPNKLMSGAAFKNTPVVADAIDGLVDRDVLKDCDESEHSVLRAIMKNFISSVCSVLDTRAFPGAPEALAKLLRTCLCHDAALTHHFWLDDFATRRGCSCVLQDLFGDSPETFAPFIDVLSGAVGGSDAVYSCAMAVLTNSLQIIKVSRRHALDGILERRDGTFEFRQDIYIEELFLRACQIHVPSELLSACVALPQGLSGITLQDDTFIIPLPLNSKLNMIRLVGLAWDAILNQCFCGRYMSLPESVRDVLVAIIRLMTTLLSHHPTRWTEIERAFLTNRFVLTQRLLASFFLLAPHEELRHEVAAILNTLAASCSENSGGYWMILHTLDRPRDLQCHFRIGSSQDFVQALWDLSTVEKKISDYTCTLAALHLVERLFTLCPLPLWVLKWPYHAVVPPNTQRTGHEAACAVLDDLRGASALPDMAQVRACDLFLQYSMCTLANHLLWPINDKAQRWQLSRKCLAITSKVLDVFAVFNWPHVVTGGCPDSTTGRNDDLSSGTAVVRSCISGLMSVQSVVLRHISEVGVVPALLRFVYCDVVERGDQGTSLGFQNALLRAHIWDSKKSSEGHLKSEMSQLHSRGWMILLIGDALDCLDKLLTLTREHQLSPHASALATHVLEQTTLPARAPQADFIKSLYAYTCSTDLTLAEKAARVFTATLVFWSSQKSTIYLSSFLSHGMKADGKFSTHLVEHLLAQVSSSSRTSVRVTFCELLAVGAELHPSVFCPHADKIVETCCAVIEENLTDIANMNEHTVKKSNITQLLRGTTHVLLAVARSTRLKKGVFRWPLLRRVCEEVLKPRMKRVDTLDADATDMVLVARTLVHLVTVALEVKGGKSSDLLDLLQTLLASNAWFSVPDTFGRTCFFTPAVRSFFLPSKEDRQVAVFFRGFLVKYHLQPELLVRQPDPVHLRDLVTIAKGDTAPTPDVMITATPVTPDWLLRSMSTGNRSNSVSSYGCSFYASQPTVKFVTSLLKAAAVATNQMVPEDLDNMEPFVELSWRKSFWDAVELFLEQYEALVVSSLSYALAEDAAGRSNESALFLEERVAPLLPHLVPFLLQLLELHDRVSDHPVLFSIVLRLTTHLLVFPPFLQRKHAPHLAISTGLLPSGTAVSMPVKDMRQLRMLDVETSDSVHLLRHLTFCFQTSARAITTFPSQFVDVCINVSSLLLALLPGVAESTRGFEVGPILLEILDIITHLVALSEFKQKHTEAAKRSKQDTSTDAQSEACGFATLLCTLAATVLESLQEMRGTFVACDNLVTALLATIGPVLSPDASISCPQVIAQVLSASPSVDSEGFLLQLSWCRRVDSVLHLLQSLASTTHGATLLIEQDIFRHLKLSQLLRWGALPVAGNNGTAAAPAYVTATVNNRPQCWRRPLHATWCHCLLLVAKLLQQAPVAAQQEVLDFIETFEVRFTYLLERGVHGGEMALHEECTVASKILGLLPRHSALTQRLLFAVAKAFSFVTSSVCGPLDVMRPYWILRTMLEKRSANVSLDDEVSCSASVPSVFHQRAQYLTFDTFRSNVQGLLQLALARPSGAQEDVPAGRKEMAAWPVVMDHVLEGGRRVFEFLNDLVLKNQCMFIRVHQEKISALSEDAELLPLSMYLLAEAPDTAPMMRKNTAQFSPGWASLPEIHDGVIYARMAVLPLLSSGGQPLGIAPETASIEDFAHLCGVTLEMVGALLFHFCTNGGNSVGVLHGFLNFLHEFRVSSIYQSPWLDPNTKHFFDSIDQSLRTSLNLGTSEAVALPN